MSDILRDLSPAGVVAAIEANVHAWWAYYQHAPQAEVHDEPDLLWVAGGIPIAEYSVVARTTFAPGTPSEAIDARIAAVLDNFAARKVGMQWYVGPSSRPADIGQRLLAHGLAHLGNAPGMAADLDALGAGVPPPEGLVVRRVSNGALLRQWARVAAEGYGEPEPVVRARIAVHTALGFARDAPLQRFVALLDGEPVAMSELFLGAGVAGVYDVATVKHARRRGAGSAVTRAALRAARTRGYHVAVLDASPMGEPVYRRLGFSEYCRLDLYEWRP
ncbi:MAG TPA: GNAT family N-acetyltransferase [Ktedonobacterales bacterium]